MSKKYSIILILAVIFLVSLVSAVQNCDNNQIIMKLSGEDNAHGALWNNNDYTAKICYDAFFASSYTGADPHQCTSTNKVLGLFQTGNSNAQAKEETSYITNVCYGDLVCHTIDFGDGQRCNNNEKVVASLFQRTNSHISLGNEPNYNFKVCCDSVSAPAVPQCSDGIDNDNDGLIDIQDPDCIDNNDNIEGTNQCNDGLDNDQDNLIDFCESDGSNSATCDPDCTDANDPLEGTNQCNDGLDNDNDGLIDTQDPDCIDNNDNIEGTNQCNDGLDNDQDTLIDFCESDGSNSATCDPDCTDANDPLEGRVTFGLTAASWNDMKDEVISNADLNDLVKLVATGAGLENKEITYQIFKQGITEPWFTATKTARSSTKDFLEWRAGKKNDGSLSGGTYSFKAFVEDKEVGSGDLVVLANEVNTPPVANIFNPINKQIYFLNEKLNFTQKSSDSDDKFNFIWNFGDGVILTGNSSNLSSFNYFYSEAGQKNIVLTVTDGRGLISVHRISILIVASSYILTYIDLPEFGKTYGRTLDFDASSSYAVSVNTLADGCTREIICLAGNCPAQTKGCPLCYPEKTLNCPVPVANPNQPFSNLNFAWVFKRGDIDAGQKSAVGDAGVAFTRTFPAIGFYIAELTVNIISDSLVLSSTKAEFGISFTEPTCFIIKDENDKKFIPGSKIGESYWVSESSVINSNENCYDPIGVDRSGESSINCCRENYRCDINSNKCVFIETEQSCQDFSESECSDQDNQAQIAYNELTNLVNTDPRFPGGCDYIDLYGEKCDQVVSCRCEWNSAVGKCNAVAKHKIRTLDLSRRWDYQTDNSEINNICLSSDESQTGKCVFDFTYTGDCNEGNEFIARKWTADWTYGTNPPASANVPDYCSDGSDTVSCEKAVRLPFFSFFNLIAVILILVVFYYFKIKNIKIIKPY